MFKKESTRSNCWLWIDLYVVFGYTFDFHEFEYSNLTKEEAEETLNELEKDLNVVFMDEQSNYYKIKER